MSARSSVHWNRDRAERWVSRRGRWWDALIPLALLLAASCSPRAAHAEEAPPASDSYAVDGGSAFAPEVQAYLDSLYAASCTVDGEWRCEALDSWAWDLIARCETGGNWSHQTRNYTGGLGFRRSTWIAYGGRDFAASGGEATRLEQQVVGRRIRDSVGGRYSGWQNCARRLGLPR